MSTELVRSVTLSSVYRDGHSDRRGDRGNADTLWKQCWKELPRFLPLPSYSCKLWPVEEPGCEVFLWFSPSLIAEFDFSCLLWKCHTGIWCGHGFLGLFMEVSSLKWPELKINDVWGFSHLHKATVCRENSRVVWAPCGPFASVPKSQLFAKCLQTCVIFKEL